MNYRIKIFLYTVIIFATACVPSKPVYEEEVLPADRLVKKLEANRRKIKTFEGSGVLNVQSPNLEAKKPDSLKFIIYGPFGIDLAQALVTDSEFIFHDVIKNIVYKGRSDTDLLKKIFHVDLSFSELVDAFAGAVNLTGKLRLEPDVFNLDDDDYQLIYLDSLSGNRSEYLIQINNLAIKNYKFFKSPNIPLFEGIYTDFEIINNVAIPYSTTVQNIVDKQKVIIDYRNISVNHNIERLVLNIPSDARIKEL